MQKNSVVRIITVSAIIFIVLLVIALTLNLIRLSNANAKRARLERELAAIETMIAENNSRIDYVTTDEYIDRYAREYLNMIGEDEDAFTGKKDD